MSHGAWGDALYARARTWLPLAAAAVALAALLFSWSEVGWTPVPPVDDTYIYLQYARQVARGEPFAYNPGDPASTGATSVPYALALAPLFLLGFDGALAVAALQVLGALLFGLGVRLVMDLGRDLEGPATGLAAGLLVAANGQLLWAACSGMDTFPFALVILLALRSLAQDLPAGRTGRAAFWLSLACAFRPEGLGLAVAAAPWLVLTRGGRPGRAGAAVAAAGVLGAAAPFLVCWLLNGDPWPNSVAAKSVTTDAFVGPLEGLALASFNVAWTFREYLGGSALTFGMPVLHAYAGRAASMSVPPLGALLLCAWALRALCRPAPADRGLSLAFLWLAAGAVGGSVMLRVYVHWGRYLMPFLPLLALLAAAGLCIAGRALVRAGAPPRAGVVLACLAALACLPSVPFYAAALAADSRDIATQHGEAARWVAGLPDGTVVATHDVGALRFLDPNPRHLLVDVVGLTENGAAPSFRAGTGSLVRWLQRRPAARRPAWLVAFASTHALDAAGVLDEERRFLVVGSSITSPGVDAPLVASRLRLDRWVEAAAPRGAPEGLVVVDSLVVGDLADEAAHGYRAEATQSQLAGVSVVRVGAGAETVRRAWRETFTLKVRRGRPLVLGCRSQARMLAAVTLDGRAVGVLGAGEGSAGQDLFLAVPAEATGADAARVVVEELGEFPAHRAVCRWWALQEAR